MRKYNSLEKISNNEEAEAEDSSGGNQTDVEYMGARYIKVANETELAKLPSDSPERESYMTVIGEE